MLGSLLGTISVVELELVILDVLREAVNLDLGLVHLDLGVENTHRVDFALCHLLGEDGPFAHANRYGHAVGFNVVHGLADIFALIGNHLVEVKVTHLARVFGRLDSLQSLLLDFLVLLPAFLSLRLHLLAFVEHFIAALVLICFHLFKLR